jgi:hypothetical protein
LEARYDSGAISPSIYAVLSKLRRELNELKLRNDPDKAENGHG